MEFIPWAKPTYWGNEKKYLNDAFDSTWLSGGPYIEKFEKECGQFLNIPFSLAVSNGTTALNLALLCAGIRPGDEVIIPGFGFMAAANIAIQLGGVPVFIDVDPDTWCLDVDLLDQKITKKTRLIIPIHTYGNVCDMHNINAIAQSKNIIVVEDAAESFGSKIYGVYSGCLSPIGTFSFHATKTITTGEGGLVVTNNPDLYEKMQLVRSHGMWRKKFYWHDAIGHNFRITNLQAAIGLAQIEKVDQIIEKKRELYRQYIMRLGEVGGIKLQIIDESVQPVIWAIAMKLDAKAYPQGRDKVIEEMLELGIETRPGFYTPTSMTNLYSSGRIPNSERISREVISLPSFPTITNDEIDFICSSLIGLKK